MHSFCWFPESVERAVSPERLSDRPCREIQRTLPEVPNPKRRHNRHDPGSPRRFSTRDRRAAPRFDTASEAF
jgi:hypothetical protein